MGYTPYHPEPRRPRDLLALAVVAFLYAAFVLAMVALRREILGPG